MAAAEDATGPTELATEVTRFMCDECRNSDTACEDCEDAFQNHNDYLYDIWVDLPVYNK